MKSKFKWILTLLVLAFSVQLSIAQEKTLSGVVSESGLPLPGVSVVIKGTTTGTQTNLDGKYSLKVKPGDVLVFSFIGQKDVTQVVGASNVLNVSMASDEAMLDEVVVTALGIKRSSKALGYATQEVKSEDLNKAANTSLAGALQGKVAGVQITPSSGAPGASAMINIRGARSFTGDNTPLYVIDGMPVTSTTDYVTQYGVTGADVSNRAADIDPNDIESINILKGQAASALYGIRASNGVILITTKSGKGLAEGKPVINFSTSTSFETISKKPSLQSEYAQGGYDGDLGIIAYNPYTSISWGPKISELPNDPIYGGNKANELNGGTLRPGMYYVPQRASAGLDPWVKPRAYNNIDEYFRSGQTITNSLNISQNTGKTNYAFGIGTTKQTGMMLGTGMNRYNVKLAADTKLNSVWKTGFSANYVQTDIDKSSGGSDSPLNGVFAAPTSYDLKGIPYRSTLSPYEQVHFRNSTFNNPYWAAENNEFSEKTNRFYGNANVEYAPIISLDGSQSLTFKYQLGLDSYTTNLRNIYEFGHRHDMSGGSSKLRLFGTTKDVINSLFTINYNLDLSENVKFDALLGTEYNHEKVKMYDDNGYGLNFGGWGTIDNATSVTSEESRYQYRTVGFFANAGLSFKDMIFLSGSVRKDIVSSMPRDNRSFVYPSASLSWVLTEIEGLKGSNFLSFAKLRTSYAEVGQAGDYTRNYFDKPSYGGGFFGGVPVTYPVDGVNSYIPYPIIYDDQLKPQNTESYEFGADLRFFNNRFGIDYTFSRQNVKNQIFDVPLAGSTGAQYYVTNGGKIHTLAHEVSAFIVPVRTQDFEWNINVNFSKIDSYVDELKEGVESITLGGYVEPQVRANVGDKFPVIYGIGFARNENGDILVDADGVPEIGEEKALGEVAPKFMLGGSMNFKYKRWTLGATVDWKNGGKIYSRTNNLLAYYGVDSRTADRETPYVFPGVKADGSSNDIALGGPGLDSTDRQYLENVLSNITEHNVYDASFVKLREVALGYTFPKMINKQVDIRVSAFARNILLWSKMPNLDPEASQGNNNMAGGFEEWTIPQAKSFGMALNFTF